jgi:hypothetical protein
VLLRVCSVRIICGIGHNLAGLMRNSDRCRGQDYEARADARSWLRGEVCTTLLEGPQVRLSTSPPRLVASVQVEQAPPPPLPCAGPSIRHDSRHAARHARRRPSGRALRLDLALLGADRNGHTALALRRVADAATTI